MKGKRINRKVDRELEDEGVYFIEDEEETLSWGNTLSILAFIILGLYLFSPGFRESTNEFIQFLKAFKEDTTDIKSGESPRRLVDVVESESKEDVKVLREGNKDIGVDLLFNNDKSLGSRFVGMAEGNYLLGKSGTYSNSPRYYGHEEPSGAVPDNTINRGFCSTPIKGSMSKSSKVLLANAKCMKRLKTLMKEVKNALKLGDKIKEPQLTLVLTAVDLGNQARSEVRKNMYITEIPKALESNKQITLVDITRMRRDSFRSAQTGQLKSALDTIAGLRNLSMRLCGNQLEVNVIAVDQARRAEEGNKALNKVGFGLPHMTRKEIMKELCVRNKA